MILIGNTLVSLEVIQVDFVCNISKCKGTCCEKGDYGAPLTLEEARIIRDELKFYKPYMSANGIDTVLKRGVSERDPSGDLVTTLNNGKECAFAVKENRIWKCSIEKAYEAGKSSLIKPLSCHLYPVRVSQVGEYIALNYDKWDICSEACALGSQLKVPVYKFLKIPLIRAFGEDWYKELDEVAADLMEK